MSKKSQDKPRDWNRAAAMERVILYIAKQVALARYFNWLEGDEVFTSLTTNVESSLDFFLLNPLEVGLAKTLEEISEIEEQDYQLRQSLTHGDRYVMLMQIEITACELLQAMQGEGAGAVNKLG